MREHHMTPKQVIAYEDGRMAYVKEKDHGFQYEAKCPYFHGGNLYHYWHKGRDDEKSRDETP